MSVATAAQLLRPLRTPEVTLYSGTESDYLYALVSGFSDLQKAGLIRLRYRFTPEFALAAQAESYGLWAKFCWQGSESGQTIPSTLAYFDLLDSSDIADIAVVEKADLYFKRGYQQSVIDRLPAHLGKKVVAMPLNHPVCTDTYSARARVKRALRAGDWRATPLLSMRRTLASALRQTPLAATIGVRRLPPRPAELIQSTTKPLEPRVYFRTRLYDTALSSSAEVAEQLSELNTGRIALIKVLREAFGERAFAGLYESPGSKKYAPELITPLPEAFADSTGHRRFSHRFLLNINTVGVAGSNGWKIPEVLASGCCLVTETLQHEPLNSLEANVHMASFQSPAECVTHCEHLLSNPEAATRMRIAGQNYYRQFLQPDIAMARVLVEAHSRPDSTNPA